jgi:biopolymer transport protein ExbB/TolQ
MLSAQLQEANQRLTEFEARHQDSQALASLDGNLESGVDSLEELASESETLDTSVTLQFRILQASLAREKANRERAETAAEEAKEATEQANRTNLTLAVTMVAGEAN